ncbi:MAG: PEP-CTERM sorting domain-containing protein [Pirellula sp.]|jgi:hypothetical protein|nr:PEP-CTERM sorting domain-containing protein [Pirellula sp.]
MKIPSWQAIMFGTCSFGMIAFANPLQAGLVFSIDLDPNTAGVQNSISVQPGDSVTAALVLELTEATSLDSYRISLRFDTAGLAFNEATASPLSGFRNNSSVQHSGGVVSAFGAESLQIGAGPSAPLTGVIGTVKFTALGASGMFVVEPWEDPVFDGSFDNNFLPLAPTLQSGAVNISAVPEPSSMALLALSLLPLLCRKKLRGTSVARRSAS